MYALKFDICSEATCACNLMNCKYIEVSASLNHRVDELLVGIVRQIRKRQLLHRSPTSASETYVGLGRKRSARSRHSSTSSVSGNGDRVPTGGIGGGGSGDSSYSCSSGGSLTSVGGCAVVNCPDGATAALCSVRAVKELFKEMFAGSDAAACIQAAASDTDCENLLEL